MISTLHLSILPIEIQCLIFRLLDPIGLISVSQASSHFRALINPQKIHFVERLLAIECRPLEQDGGGIPTWSYCRYNYMFVEDVWKFPEWRTMKWGCSSCLRLLPYTSFDRYNIFEFFYRKPFSGSPAAEQPTSWENLPRDHRAQKKDLERIEEGRKNVERHMDAFIIYIERGRASNTLDQTRQLFYDLQEIGMASLMGMTLTEFMELDQIEVNNMLETESHANVLEYCGLERYLRQCNECGVQISDSRAH